ncbi:MAG TPA: pyridoxal 5'-phosphate synthase glutaminase subunit PdxT [Solirubrobacteraceae bacterium]|nr:pyridoxal 5'-phosphate synthase glutaminase subunit PdxT [Solirubrobacteraceae bacterium]
MVDGTPGRTAPSVGVLALQGDFADHARLLRGLGAHVREVRTPGDLEGLDGLVIPGGESTVMSLGIEREGLAGPLRDLHARGTPILGTCAGLIMVDRKHLGLMDITARRNAFGRQLHSFEADLDVAGVGVRAVFIRAPWIDEAGPDVQILAEVDGHPVAARQGRVLVLAFHPEIQGDDRLHRLFLEQVAAPDP